MIIHEYIQQHIVGRVPRAIALGALRTPYKLGRNKGLVPSRHSRAGGNPGLFSWIPGLALLARNDGLP